MAMLVYVQGEKTYNVELSLEKGVPVSLSVDEEHQWHFSKDKTIQECLAQIVRADNGFRALIVSRGREVKVNKFPVMGLHVLRNTERIQVEQEEISFYEWLRLEVSHDTKLLNAVCPFCTLPFQVGDRLMFCPKCDTAMHDTCWTARGEVSEGCIVPNCGYLPPGEDPYVPLDLHLRILV